ncbi:MAG: thioredoxin family protein [Pseudohongiellaceae bacterium]
MPATAPSFALIVKRACPTCELIAPVIPQLADSLDGTVRIYSQDDPGFPAGVAGVIDDRELEFSYRNRVEIVPTLIRFAATGEESARVHGWDRQQWQEFTGLGDLGADLLPFKPGCGSRTLDPGMQDELAQRFESGRLTSRQIVPAPAEDLMEACYERGWTDGLPVVPPTPARVLRMLRDCDLEADAVIGLIPPDFQPGSVEKIAINAVMAGCKPEYFPTVLATVRGALQDAFCMHGVLCTTYFSSPVVIVNGPEARRIGMNAGGNALGQGNRANATIGRALQLVIQNVGGGVPGGIDRATLGNPGKYTFCFSEDESDSDWPSLAMDRGFEREDSVVSLFAGEGPQPILDQLSRTPESLARSMAASLRSVAHVKRFGMADAILIVSPEHRRVFREAGWGKEDLRRALYDELMTPGAKLLPGVDGMAEGMPEKFKDKLLSKFRDDGLHIVTAGGTAGMFSAIISGWVASGERGSQLVSQRIT